MTYYERIQKSIEYVEQHLDGEIDLSIAAKEAFMSLSNFYRLFFALTGYSIKEYVRLRRINLSVNDVLSGDMRIIDIAAKYDFESADSFSRAFKRITGFLPSVFKKENRSFQFERISIVDKYFAIQDKKLLEKHPDIKVMKELEPMKVAYYVARSNHPEVDAFKVIKEWAARNNLLGADAKYRLFGFDSIDAKMGDKEYGYEIWMTVDNGFIVNDEKVKCKTFDGGLYAVTSTTVSDVVDTWDRFREWLKISKYDLGSHQYFEEHFFENFENDNEALENIKLDLYMPVVLKSNKRKEVLSSVKVAYYRAEDSDSEKAAMNAWNIMLSWAKSNKLDSENHKIYVFNQGFKKTKISWQEIMITIADDFSFDDENVKTKIFEGGIYMAMDTNLSSLPNAWCEMWNWQKITKVKAGRHQWAEEWKIDGWNWPEKGIKVLYPIKD